MIVQNVQSDNKTIQGNSYLADQIVNITVPNGYKVLGCVGFTNINRGQIAITQCEAPFGGKVIYFSAKNTHSTLLTGSFTFRILFIKII